MMLGKLGDPITSRTMIKEGYRELSVLTKVKVKLGYVDPGILKPHEKYIESRVETLLESIRRTGYLLRPLIVDEITGSVVDGAHRLEALKRIGVSRIPVVMVDYLNEDEIKVDRWIRVYEGNVEVLRRLLKLIEDNIPGRILESRGSRIVYEVNEDTGSKAYRILSALEEELGDSVKLRFKDRVPRRDSNKLIVLPPRLRKIDVVEAALKGELLPPKTTRHVTILKRVMLKVRVFHLL